jgi:uncharacterized protein
MSTEVRHEPDRSRYALYVDGDDAGEVNYRIQDGAVAMLRVVVDPHRRGEGLGSQLVQGALDDVRANGSGLVIAACPFVTTFFEEHPEYRDLEA